MQKILVAALLVVGGMSFGSSGVATAPSVLTVDGDADVPAGSGELDHGGSCAMNPVCTTGSHVRGASLSHGFLAFPATYSGTVTSAVIQQGSTNARIFTCVVANGGVVACNGQGTFPVVGSTFDHQCAATGTWAIAAPLCTITHT